MSTLKPDHEVALRCLYWLPADMRPTAELLAELMYVTDGEAAQMLSELRSARLLANARARGIPCAALERHGPRRARLAWGRAQRSPVEASELRRRTSGGRRDRSDRGAPVRRREPLPRLGGASGLEPTK